MLISVVLLSVISINILLTHGLTNASVVRGYFLSQHAKCLKLSHTIIAGAVKCDVATAKYWFQRWKQSKDLNDSIRADRVRETAPKTG